MTVPMHQAHLKTNDRASRMMYRKVCDIPSEPGYFRKVLGREPVAFKQTCASLNFPYVALMEVTNLRMYMQQKGTHFMYVGPGS